MTYNSVRERRRKRLAQMEVINQCTRYENECTYKGSKKLTKDEIEDYINAVDKTAYLKKIGKCFG